VILPPLAFPDAILSPSTRGFPALGKTPRAALWLHLPWLPGINFTNIFGAKAEQLFWRLFFCFLWQQHLAKLCPNMAPGAKAVA